MELAFKTYELPYLKRTIREIRTQEETGETIVPDSFPDISTICDAFAEAVLRSKECRNGSVTLSGGIKGGIIYSPEDHSWPRNLDFYIPFSVKIDHPALTERSHIQCSVRVRNVDGRMINSRKAMLRVDLAFCVTAFEEETESIYELQSKPESLQLREQTYTFTLPLETAEKAFVVSDTVEVPSGKPSVEKIYKLCTKTEITEQKLVGNKGVFKGVLWCKLLYLAEDHNLYTHQQQFRFSQYCEFQSDYEDELLCFTPILTDCDLEAAGQDNVRKLLLSAHLLAQGVVYGNKELTFIEDAYATKGRLAPAWQEKTFETYLDSQKSQQNIRQQLTGELKEIVDADFYIDFPVSVQEEERVKITTPFSMHVLGMGDDGEYAGLSGKTEAVQEIAAAENTSCIPTTEAIGACYTAVLSGGVEVRCDAVMQDFFFAKQKVRSLCGGTIEDDSDNDAKKPSVIIRKIEQDADLWEVAKSCLARKDAIISVNRLDSDRLTEEQILLIPIG